MTPAEELYQIAKTAADSRDEILAQKEYVRILDDAKVLAADGKFGLKVENLYNFTKRKLQAAGFKVSYCTGSQYDPSTYYISWDKN